MIRKATMKDLEAIVSYNKLLAYETEGLKLDEKILNNGVATALSDEGKALYWVYEKDGRVVGQLMLTKEWSDWRNGEIWWIQSVYVDKEYRKNKIFTSLYEYVRDQVKIKKEVVGLRLYVEKENNNAQKTYKKLGMEETYYKLYEWMEREN